MANFYMNPYSGSQLAGANPETIPSADTSAYGSSLIVYSGKLVMASQASGSTLTAWRARAGLVFLGGALVTDTSLSTATLAVGNATTAGLYRAAAVLTTVGTPQTFFDGAAGFLANFPLQIAPYEEVILTVGTAALPASGNLVAYGFYATV